MPFGKVFDKIEVKLAPCLNLPEICLAEARHSGFRHSSWMIFMKLLKFRKLIKTISLLAVSKLSTWAVFWPLRWRFFRYKIRWEWRSSNELQKGIYLSGEVGVALNASVVHREDFVSAGHQGCTAAPRLCGHFVMDFPGAGNILTDPPYGDSQRLSERMVNYIRIVLVSFPGFKA